LIDSQRATEKRYGGSQMKQLKYIEERREV